MTQDRDAKPVPRPMPEGTIGTAQAAALSGRHQRTIVSWIHSSRLKAAKLPGKRGPYLINEDDLMDLVKELDTPQPYIPRDTNES